LYVTRFILVKIHKIPTAEMLLSNPEARRAVVYRFPEYDALFPRHVHLHEYYVSSYIGFAYSLRSIVTRVGTDNTYCHSLLHQSNSGWI